MSEVFARKQGRVLTVFVDILTNTPLPIRNFDDEPAGGFPSTFTGEDAVLRAFPGRTLRLVEKLMPPQPEAVRPANAEAEIAKLMKDTLPAATKQAPPNALPQNGQELSRALQYFKILLAQSSVAAKNKQERVRLQVETCANLILAVWPGSIEQIESARQEMNRFSL